MFNRKIFILFLSVLICVYLWLNLACQTKQKVDLRTLAPAETLVYLETNDLGNTFKALTESKSWKELATETPNFSYVNQTQIAVAITGFEAKGEAPVFQFQPKFVAIANTNLSESNNLSLIETKIGEFVKANYGDDAKLEKLGNKFIWSDKDGSKVFANTSEQIVYFSNDEKLLDKCLSVKRSESENLTKNEALAKVREQNQDSLAYGYATPEAIPQLANFASIFLAKENAEEEETQSIISKVLPTILQKTVQEIVWSTKKSEQGIEDKFVIKTNSETANAWKETVSVSNENVNEVKFIPNNPNAISVYHLQNPLLAWRGVIASTSNKLDPTLAKAFPEFANSLLESYEIKDAESFVSSIKNDIYSVRFDEEGDESVIIVGIKDEAKLKKSLTIDFNSKSEQIENANVWKNENDSVAIIDGKMIIGDNESVLRCLKANTASQNQFDLTKLNAVSTTFTKENPNEVIDFFTDVKESNESQPKYAKTETNFTNDGIERKTVSDFGVIGWILENIE
jgi:hypothetical protein